MGIDLSTLEINAFRGKQLFLLNLPYEVRLEVFLAQYIKSSQSMLLLCSVISSLLFLIYYLLIASAVIIINNSKNVFFFNLNRNIIIFIFFDNFCNISYSSLTHCKQGFIAVRKIFIITFHLSFIFNYQYQSKNRPFDIKFFLVYFVGRYCNHTIIFSN